MCFPVSQLDVWNYFCFFLLMKLHSHYVYFVLIMSSSFTYWIQRHQTLFHVEFYSHCSHTYGPDFQMKVPLIYIEKHFSVFFFPCLIPLFYFKTSQRFHRKQNLRQRPACSKCMKCPLEPQGSRPGRGICWHKVQFWGLSCPWGGPGAGMASQGCHEWRQEVEPLQPLSNQSLSPDRVGSRREAITWCLEPCPTQLGAAPTGDTSASDLGTSGGVKQHPLHWLNFWCLK